MFFLCSGSFCFRFRCSSFSFRRASLFVCLFACCGIRGNYYILITHAFPNKDAAVATAAVVASVCVCEGDSSRAAPKNNRKNVNENGVKNQFHGFYIPVYLL